MLLSVPGVKSYRKGGKLYCYWRKTGERLPNDPIEMMIRIAEIQGRARPVDGTFHSLITRYLGSPEYKQLADLTRRDYMRHLSAIREQLGKFHVTDFQRKHARKMRDELASRPRKANYRLQVLSLLLNFGIELDEDLYGSYNVVAGIKKLREGPGYAPWPDNVIAHAMASAYSELRWVITAALETGQRGEDVVAMTWVHYNGASIEVMQQKTRTRVWVPASKVLRTMLADVPKRQAVMFTTPTGKPWNLGHLRHEVARVLLPHKGYGLHGLRFKAARRLREAGCEWDQIAAILGHRTTKMARMYAERSERASEAIVKLERM